MTKSNPRCPFPPGSLECLGATWKNPADNLCQECPYWDELCEEEWSNDEATADEQI